MQLRPVGVFAGDARGSQRQFRLALALRFQAMKVNRRLTYSLPLLLVSSVLICGFLLSACSTPIRLASATPPPSFITHQDYLQLETYQHWMTVMLQSGGDVSAYKKQYEADRHALV